MQWADAGLLDFVEYLLEWSRDHPLFVLVLARPELLDAARTGAPGTATSRRSTSSRSRRRRWTSSSTASCPACRSDCASRSSRGPRACRSTRSRRCGCCSTEACSSRRAPIYRPTGEIESLEVPETLHALVAARLDGLPPEERRLLQDAAVLGKTFTQTGARSSSADVTEAELEPLLGSLVRKEVLGVQADPRSPEHGQYGFLQDLVRHVAYETLSKTERRRATSRRPRTSMRRVRRRGRDRRGARLPLPRRVRGAPRRRRRSRDQGEGTRGARARRRARRVARRRGRGAALLRAGGRAHRRARSSGPRSSSAPGWLGDVRAQTSDEGRAAARRVDRAPREHEATAVCSARLRPARRGRDVSGPLEARRIARVEAAFADAARSTSRDDELAESRRLGQRCLPLPRRDEKALEKSELAIELAESLGSPEILARALSAKALVIAGQDGLKRRSRCAAPARARPRARSHGARGQRTLQPLRPHASGATATRKRSPISPTRSRSRAASAIALWRVERHRGDDVPPLHARPLGRGARGLRRGAGGSAARRADDELPELDARDPHPSRETRPGARSLLAIYATHGDSADVQDKAGYDLIAAAVRTRRGSARGSPPPRLRGNRAGPHESEQASSRPSSASSRRSRPRSRSANTQGPTSSSPRSKPFLPVCAPRTSARRRMRFRARLAASDEAATRTSRQPPRASASSESSSGSPSHSSSTAS